MADAEFNFVDLSLSGDPEYVEFYGIPFFKVARVEQVTVEGGDYPIQLKYRDRYTFAYVTIRGKTSIDLTVLPL